MSFERKKLKQVFNKALKVCHQIIFFTVTDSETLLTFICHEKGTYFK